MSVTAASRYPVVRNTLSVCVVMAAVAPLATYADANAFRMVLQGSLLGTLALSWLTLRDTPGSIRLVGHVVAASTTVGITGFAVDAGAGSPNLWLLSLVPLWCLLALNVREALGWSSMAAAATTVAHLAGDDSAWNNWVIQLILITMSCAAGVAGRVSLDRSQRIALRKDRAMQVHQLRAQVLMEHLDEAVVTLDSRGAINSANPAARRLLGTSVEGVKLAEMLESLDGEHLHDADLAPGRRARWTLKVPSGEYPVHLSVTGLPRTTSSHDDRVVLLRELSESIRLAQLQDDFVSSVNHELRTPLTSIRGALELLTATKVSLDEDQRMRLLQIATSNSLRLTALVDDLLDLARLEQGGLAFERTPLDLRDVVQSAVGDLMATAHQARIKLVVDTSDEQDTRIRGDAGRLAQVVTNLASNAIKFSPMGSTVMVSIRRQGESICLLVRDQGPGVHPDDHERIFRRFHRVAGANSQGTGLGLAIVRQLVQLHGGTVAIDSVPGQGATFRVELPALNH